MLDAALGHLPFDQLVIATIAAQLGDGIRTLALDVAASDSFRTIHRTVSDLAQAGGSAQLSLSQVMGVCGLVRMRLRCAPLPRRVRAGRGRARAA